MMIILDIQIIDFDEYAFEAVGIIGTREVRVDPFVTCLWDWEDRESLRGLYSFEGHWNSDVFLAVNIVK